MTSDEERYNVVLSDEEYVPEPSEQVQDNEQDDQYYPQDEEDYYPEENEEYYAEYEEEEQ